MKTERRHELQENSLAKGIVGLPSLWSRHGSKVLLAVVGVALLVVLVNYRGASTRRGESSAKASLADVQGLMDDLRMQEMSGMPQDELARFRAGVATQAGAAVGAVVNQARSLGDDALLADASVTRGDLNWLLANLVELPGATTRPALKMEQVSDAYLQAAQDAYQGVLDQKSKPSMQTNQARFGLAAVAENRRDWDSATKFYQAVADDAAAIDGYKSLAQIRLNLLPQLKSGVRFVRPTTAPTTMMATPTTLPTTSSVALPTTLPTTTPAAQ